jgi:cytochrome oxidase Cu insertion factor (SCO1/SenC/PrrC family)
VTLRAIASVSPRVSAWARLCSLGAVLVLVPLTPKPALSQEPDPVRAARWMDDLMWGHGHVGGPFALIDHTGRRRTDADFRGKLLIVYFGYTTCPDVCPTDLIQISLAIDKLGTAGDNIQPLFVSLDPERDTPSVLARYVSKFHRRLIGLTGTREQVRAVADSYKAYYAKYVPPGGAVDVIDHTGFIYLVGRDGQYIGFFPPGTSANRLLEIIRPYLARH